MAGMFVDHQPKKNMLDPAVVLGMLNEVERRFPVHDWVLEGVRLWPIFRIQWFFALRPLYTSQTPVIESHGKWYWLASSAASRTAGYIRYFRSLITDARHNAPWSPCDALFLGDQVSRIFLDGQWYDKLCEPIMEHLRDRRGFSSLHLDPYHDYRVPRHAPSIFIQPQLDLAFLASLRTHGRYVKALMKLEGIADMQAYFKAQSGISPGITPMRIEAVFSYILAAARYFDSVLKRTTPKLVFTVEYYSLTGMALTLACCRRGIKTIEIPHGNHGEIHPAYSRWNNVPTDGYELLPTIFWCWSQDEYQSIRRWTEPAGTMHQAFLGGNWWMDLWLSNDSRLVRAHQQKLQQLLRQIKSDVHILTTYEYDYADLLDLIERAPQNWHWWIRIHPTKLQEREVIRKRFQERNIRNYTLDAATDLPLYALLKALDVHVTECSSVTIEAAAFRIPTVIVRSYGEVAFVRQIEHGSATAAHDFTSIISAIRRMSELKRSSPPGFHESIAAQHKDAFDSLLSDLLGRQELNKAALRIVAGAQDRH